ncbi:MAG TPA: hypothetical protein VJ792_03180 [Candidatus Nitrosotalea sp.]|nr:hypothetical protein [Candidatus Nitrosotalea sp.]
MKYAVLSVMAIAALLLPNLAFQQSHAAVPTNLVPESDVSMTKSVVTMHIPPNPSLPFGCVWGTVQNAAPGYPVDIEIYKDSKPVYFAQADVKADGSYEKYFRVANTVNGHEANIFEGDYTVEIFKYVISSASGTNT